MGERVTAIPAGDTASALGWLARRRSRTAAPTIAITISPTLKANVLGAPTFWPLTTPTEPTIASIAPPSATTKLDRMLSSNRSDETDTARSLTVEVHTRDEDRASRSWSAKSWTMRSPYSRRNRFGCSVSIAR